MGLRRIAAITIGGLAAAAVIVRRRRTPDDPAPAPSLGRASRTAEVARASTKAGSAYALHRARRVFADAETRELLDMEFELKTAEQVAATLGNMKGAMMKLGQMASYLDQGLPEHVREALAQLQADAPPMSGELAADVIEAELGRRPDDLFLEWDPKPIAAASIGQVHRAITRDGLAVAVKVQYPGIDEAITADLGNAGMVFGGLGKLFPGLEPGPLVEELRERLVEELDYRIEADNQRLFADAYRDHPFIHVPDVVGELSTKRVLVTELAEGVRFEEAETWSQEERNLIAESIFRFVFRSLYRLRAFNGDPHPGNYLVRPGGHVVFLDFGLVKRFSDEEMDGFTEMIRALVIDDDLDAFRAVIDRTGLLKDNERFPDDLVREYFGHFYDWVLHDEPKAMTPEYASESVRRMFDSSGKFGDLMRAANIPPSFVIIQRINLGLYAVMGQLRATGNWRRVAEELWPFVDGPPSTELGRLERDWLDARGG